MLTWLSRTCGLTRRSALVFLRSEAAPTAVEYAIMVGLIGVVIVAAVMALGNTIASLFQLVTLGSSL